MRYIFGPLNSRRFGLSLGIDLSPDEKSCNFDCLYCELKPNKPISTIKNPPKVKDIISELKDALKKFKNIDVITVTANGEPTLYPYLDELIDKISEIKNGYKTLILSNGSTIYKKDIQKALLKFDIVKLSLDCATPKCFKKIDRPLKDISLEDIIKGMVEFSKKYIGSLIIEILVVSGINDKKEEFRELNRVLQEIKPVRVDIGTIDRPPAYKVSPVSYERLLELSKEIKDIPISIAHRDKNVEAKEDFSEEEILNTLRHRPLTKDDIKAIFSDKSLQIFNNLLKKKKIIEKNVGNTTFYASNIDK